MSVYLSFAHRMAVDSFRDRDVHLALLTGYAQDPSHTWWSQISSHEVSGSGYVSGGVPVFLDCVIVDNEVEVQVATVDFGLLGVASANTAVFYDKTGSPSTSRLLAADSFGSEIAIAGQKFRYALGGGWSLSIPEIVID